jgi:hypothetical protein
LEIKVHPRHEEEKDENDISDRRIEVTPDLAGKKS